ncbi:MAG: oxidoreductase [Flavobacteriaceae bacterium]|nr:oxidoreductase [Flavobacteriaceae bacterium]
MKKIGLIGLGKMGMSHLAIANQTPGIEVAAVCDTSGPLLRVIRKNTGFECFKNYEKMIAETELDGVMVLVPNAFHYDVSKYCLEQNLNIFVEKPLTLTYEKSSTLAAMAKERNLKGQVGYVNRFNSIFQYVKKLLDANVIGEVSNYINTMTGGVVLKENSRGWRNDYEQGGGCLLDYGPHCFDLATYFFGSEVSVESSILKKVHSTKVDDIVYTTLQHQNEVVGLNYINWSDPSVRKATNTIEIMGSKGKIRANKQECSLYLIEANNQLDLPEGWSQTYVTDLDTSVSYYLRGEDFSRQLESFSGLLNGSVQAPISSLENAAAIDRILEKALQLNGRKLNG